MFRGVEPVGSFYYAQPTGSTPRNMAYAPAGYAGDPQMQQEPVPSAWAEDHEEGMH
jgi:hypothetical protein